jgi:hypothetical protein
MADDSDPSEQDPDDSPLAPAREGFEAFVRANPTILLVGALVVGVMIGRLGLL